ncbi:MAG: DUF6261 family protein [Tannerellaceae bacterium]|jgi:hypothetical protein|nr:DUF6261 family protein [Tannerellaceae bacterium]
MVVLRKSVHTKELNAADRKRDRLVKGLYGVAKGWRAYPDDARQKAAERLYILLKKYWEIILAGNRISESAAIYNLLQDLRGNYASSVSLLELTDWVAAIDAAEQEFLTARSERAEEEVEKPKENLRQLRGQMDAFYVAMTEALNARLPADGLGGNVVAEPDEVIPESRANAPYQFVITWNETVKLYRNSLAQRAGHRTKSHEAGGPEA